MVHQEKQCEHCGKLYNHSYRITRKYWEARKFCSAECRVAGMRGKKRSTYGKAKVSVNDRFWSKVSRCDTDECWPWIGAKDVSGYGYLAGTRREKAAKAHRLSYLLHYGEIPKGLCVCHKCDNPSCVNPSHLFLGTLADNNADKLSKGRLVVPYGEAHPKSKLTLEDIKSIMSLRAAGLTQTQIAKQFGIAQPHVCAILLKKIWKRRD